MFNVKISEKYADEYSTLHGEAHKRSAFAVGAPALSWHLGVFATNEGNPEKISDVIDHREMAQIAEHFFISVLDGIDVDHSYVKNKEAAYKSSNSSGQKILFLSISDILLKIAVTPHSDHFTITIVVDLSKKAHVNIKTSSDIPEDKVIKLKDKDNDKFSKLLKNSYNSYANHVAGRFSTEEETKRSKYFLQDGVWEIVLDHIFSKTFLYSNIRENIIGNYKLKIFADFRGFLINCRNMEELLQENINKISHGIVGNDGWFKEKGNQIDGLNSIFSLFKIGDKTFNYKEIIGCTLFRNRAVYMSPLGAPPVHSGAISENRRPLYFAVAVHENNRWQIGRIIHRLNTLGTLRLLALRDFRKLKNASDRIREVGEDLDEAARETDDEKHTTESRIEAEHQRLAKYKKEIDYIGKDISGHISYRVYRSRYRASQFDIQLSDLHVERIEAWQPYDEFVKRRLYPAFDFISRIGERYERLNSNYQRQLLSLNSEMQSTSAQHLVHIQDEVLESHAFQHIIESIALGYYGGLVFYYISKPYYIDISNFVIDGLNNSNYIFSILMKKYASINVSIGSIPLWECGDVEIYCQMDKYWQSFCFVLFASWAVLRFFGNQLQDKRNKRKLLLKRLGLNEPHSEKEKTLRFSSLLFRFLDRTIKDPNKFRHYDKGDVKKLNLNDYKNEDH